MEHACKETAKDPKTGMTLDELEAVVQNFRMAGIPGDACPVATVKIGGRIKRLEVKG
jgi:hypothetical protein